jgi:hypothetical protein
VVQAGLGHKARSIWKITKAKRARSTVQVVEHLPTYQGQGPEKENLGEKKKGKSHPCPRMLRLKQPNRSQPRESAPHCKKTKHQEAAMT